MTTPAPSQRLVSLDAFRGATIAGMMLVNNPGTWSAVYPQLRHAEWHGWTFTDWIFPFFLWIIGVAMTFSFARRMEGGGVRGTLLLHVARRSLIIMALGWFLSGFPFGVFGDREFSLATLRIPGVLVRIGICYGIAGAIVLFSTWRGQLAWVVGLLASYWLMVNLIPVPGYGAGILEPVGNLCWYIDSNLLAGHTWTGAPAPGFDPEGIVSTIPAIGTVLLGVLTGHFLRSQHTPQEKTARMFVAGNLLLLLGAVLDMWLPINKNLWTSSYTVFMGGWALVCLAMFYWFIDVKGWKAWAKPLVIYGMNAIAAFVLAGIVGRLLGLLKVSGPGGTPVPLKDWIYTVLFAPLADPVNASLLFAVTFMLLIYLFAWILWKRRWFIKI